MGDLNHLKTFTVNDEFESWVGLLLTQKPASGKQLLCEYPELDFKSQRGKRNVDPFLAIKIKTSTEGGRWRKKRSLS